jgi:hypothetical protein
LSTFKELYFRKVVNGPASYECEDVMRTGGETQMSSSAEAEIIREIEVLIRKLAGGHATATDIQMLQDLQRARVDSMRPKALPERHDVKYKLYA